MATVMIPPQVLLGLSNEWVESNTFDQTIVSKATGNTLLNSSAELIIQGSDPNGQLTSIKNGTVLVGANSYTGSIDFGASSSTIATVGLVNGQFTNNTNGVVLAATPSSSNPTIASGTVYQNTTGRYLFLYVPITYSPTTTAAATAAFALGASSTPATIFTNSEPAAITAGRVDTLTLSIPPGWYYSLTVVNATIGTVTEVQQ